MKAATVIDVAAVPELLRLAEEVQASGRVRLLVRDGEVLARVTPARPSRRRRPGAADRYDAFRSAAGGWANVDSERLLEDIYRDRASADRPPVDL